MEHSMINHLPALNKQEARDALAHLILRDPTHCMSRILSIDYRVFAPVALLLHGNGLLVTTTMAQVTTSVAAATRVHMVLRRPEDTLARSLMTRCAQHLGGNFFTHIYNWLLERLHEVGPAIELDPQKFLAGESAQTAAEIQENVSKLGKLIIDIFGLLEQLLAPDDAFPHLRHWAGLVADCIDARFPLALPNSGVTSGQAITLLFLLGPMYNMPIPGPPPVSRTLTILAKTFQNLVNGQQFGNKESYMVPLNPYIAQCQARLPTLAARICSASSASNIPHPTVDAVALLDQVITTALRGEREKQQLLERGAVAGVAQRVTIAGVQGGRTETPSVWLQLIFNSYSNQGRHL